MKLYSTKNFQSTSVSFEEALFKGLPEDNGLYLPKSWPRLSDSFWKNISSLSFQEIAFHMASALLKDEIDEAQLKGIIYSALDFPVVQSRLSDRLHCLELYHGPSLAFKDFGARFMAHTMSHFLKRNKQVINILVATSGDTGSAVAQGFYNLPGITVTILYPSGKVSHLQELQLTTLGGNVRAIEVDGTFDDCQALVKQAFLDRELNTKMNLSSANSINIGRLIPQSFYYAESYARLQSAGRPMAFVVPSGNFGNLCGGLIARNLGMPVHEFIAATNINDVVPQYLSTGIYKSRPSVPTLSNAMDVGNPSNFPRMTQFFDNDHESVTKVVKGCTANDEQTMSTIHEMYQRYGYIACPHTAVALKCGTLFHDNNSDTNVVALGTAHPAKFKETVDKALRQDIELPQPLLDVQSKTKEATLIDNDYKAFKDYLTQL